MKSFSVFMIFLMAVLGSSCQMNRGEAVSSPLSVEKNLYAKGFVIKHFKDYSTVNVRDPWSRDTSKLLQRYVLVNRDRPLPKALPKGTVVKVPIKRAIVYTSVQCSVLEYLDCIDDIVGVCEPQYIDSKAIKQRVNNGLIANIGEASAPNIEKMIDVTSEVILASPFENCGYGAAEKIGIPIIEFADYTERMPLARTEWIKFYGLLLDKKEKADSIFMRTCSRYDSLKTIAAEAANKPTLLAERKYGSSWAVPAGESYTCVFYEDAGADYIFDAEKGSGSINMSFETVLDRAMDADIWILKYNSSKEMSYADLRAEYGPYSMFNAFKNRRIFACNTGTSPYYDIITLHPDYLLENLIWVFHPELLPDYKPSYFFPLK